MWLTKRNSLLLTGLIKIYNSTHKPVSSNQLTALLPLSDSTIRKELQKLESFGYIYKPSSSSGRVPTNRGIKHYLKELIGKFESKREFCEFAGSPLPETSYSDFNNVSDDSLSILSDNTNNIGFIFLNSLFDLKFKKIKLIKVGSHRVMTIIHSLNKWTFSKLFRTNANYSERDLETWELILNKEFRGKTLRNSFKRIRNKLHKEKEKYIKIYRELYFMLGNEELKTAEFFFKGTLNILDSQIVNPSRLKQLLSALEEKERLSLFLSDLLNNNMYKRTPAPIVAFGADTGISELEGFILILSNFYHASA
ncbi:MAG: HTH domain-containing protein, partial [bacterium]|nr:HTH domain-containing protein [bacterium]